MRPDEIHYMDSGSFTLGCDQLRNVISWVFTTLPDDVVESVMDGCHMLIVTSEEQGVYFPQTVLGERGLIAFPETLLNQERETMRHTILHEVAHYVLRHKTFLNPVDYDSQEREADALVTQWLDEKRDGG